MYFIKKWMYDVMIFLFYLLGIGNLGKFFVYFIYRKNGNVG